jgi:hypothetical protein
MFSIQEFMHLRPVTMNLNIVAPKLWAPGYKMAVFSKTAAPISNNADNL